MVSRGQRGGQRAVQQGPAGSVQTDCVPQKGYYRWPVQGNPVFHPISQPIGGHPRAFREQLRRVADELSTRVLQRLRGVPVVRRDDGFDPRVGECVDEPVAEVGTARLDGPAAGRPHA